MPTNNQKEILRVLGPEYSLREIDLEPCIYRKINDRYDIEISGTRRKGHSMTIYVWDISRGMHSEASTVERHPGITSIESLQQILDDITRRFGG